VKSIGHALHPPTVLTDGEVPLHEGAEGGVELEGEVLGNPGPSDCDDDLTSSCIASRSVCRALLIDEVRATDFYNWNRVKIRYCDGASFAGEGFDKAQQTDHLPICSLYISIFI